MQKPSSWNRIPAIEVPAIHKLNDRHITIPGSLSVPLLAHGNGRSYSDVCLTETGTLLLTNSLDRFISFDTNKGILRCEPGVTIGELLNLVVPRGWFLASTPGTQYATIGGAVCNDVHGKNHHSVGTFGHHVTSLELWRSSGEILECSASKNPNLFKATIGGMGLTGLIRWVEIQLSPIKSAWMWVESHRFRNLREFWEINKEFEASWPYTVAWIDCLAKNQERGRGILYAGKHTDSKNRHTNKSIRPFKIPVNPPFSLINTVSLKVFNEIYYRQKTSPNGISTHYIPYFYPLDKIENWNKFYGRKGFYQYQCVIPPENAFDAINEILDVIANNNTGSFLAVLKKFGDMPSIGMISFPRPGITFALDFPNSGPKTLNLLAKLDQIVKQSGGALYPAKDARMPAEMFELSFPNLDNFIKYIDPVFSSSFWRRVRK
ncbi:MAG: FAD-binding oxidoreductase [Gammaproteobacteria bacterium]|nr:FAD-binding oxidoreductase [Gammaproteobacteria bacterium]